MTTLIILGGLIGVLICVAGVFWIIRKRHKAKTGNSSWLAERLQTEKLQSDIILNAIEDGVVVIDEQKTIRLFNPAAARLTGWNQSEAIGLDSANVLQLIDDKNKPYDKEQNLFYHVLQNGKTERDSNAILLSRNKKQISINLSVSPLLDQQQQISGAVGIFRDVSEERQQERQRAEFISTASHEMRTPVAAIEGYLALAMNDKVSRVDSKAREYLEKAHSSTQHLGKLFQDLLTSAKAEDGRLSNHPALLEMGAFMERLAEDLRFAAQKKGLLMEYIIGTGSGEHDATINAVNEGSGKVISPLYYVQVDPDRIREVITNLFDNAVKYTESGKISIGLTGNNQIVQFYVKDTGAGISAEDIPHLFQKFYRVDNSATRAVGGTGLGLFICRKIVELYNGRIWVESEPDKGSTFFINLPRLSAQKASELQSTHAPSIIDAPTEPATSTPQTN